MKIDLWVRVHLQVTSAREQAQERAADLANTRLSLHSELAIDYLEVRSADAQIQLLRDTVKAYTDAVDLTKDRYEGGASSSRKIAVALHCGDSCRSLNPLVHRPRA